MNFTLLATPAEGLSGRFIRMDKKRYGIIPGVTDRDYYTTVAYTHLDVYKRQVVDNSGAAGAAFATEIGSTVPAEQFGCQQIICLLYTSRCV